MIADASRRRRVRLYHHDPRRRGQAGRRDGRATQGQSALGDQGIDTLLSASLPGRFGRRHAFGPSALAPALPRDLLTVALEAEPLAFGYAASGWTAPLLAAHLRALFGASAAVSVRTLRRRLHAAGLAWKRPRYVFAAKEPHRAQKKGRSCAA